MFFFPKSSKSTSFNSLSLSHSSTSQIYDGGIADKMAYIDDNDNSIFLYISFLTLHFEILSILYDTLRAFKLK